MEPKTLKINVISAKDLKDVNLMTRMDVYAVVSISGDPHHPEQGTKTPIDREGRCNPTWNFPTTFTIYGPPAQQNSLNLLFKLRCDRALGDRDVGLVIVPIKELLDSNCSENSKSMQFVSYQVRRSSGRGKGELRFSYKFDDNVSAISEAEKVGDKPAGQLPAVMTYPPPPTPTVGCSSATYYGGGPCLYPPPPPPQLRAGYYTYPPPPPPVHVYPPPPQAAGYGYPQGQPTVYGYYPPPARQPSRNSNFGAGFGAGLVGGMVGGLFIGDLVSDAAGAYHAGYEAGFADAARF